MSKKNKMKNVKSIKSYSSDHDEMMRMLKVLGVVVVALVAFYFIFAIANGEISFGKKQKKEVEIQNVEILAGTIFSQEDEEYYVLMYDFDSDESVSYAGLYDLYMQNVGYPNLYLVDLGKKFNDKYLTDDESKINVSNIQNLKVTNPIMIKVSGATGVQYYTNMDEMGKALFNR